MKLSKYKLDEKVTIDYLTKHLKRLNTLSKNIVMYTPFDKGICYTYLNNDIDIESLHEFKYGGVANGAREKVSSKVLIELQTQKDAVCVFDDYNARLEKDKDWHMYKKYGVHIGEEMYYCIEKNEANTKIINECFNESDTIWHSLAVVSTGITKRPDNQTLTNEDYMKIAENATHVILLAYDEESYIIWERRNSS